MLEGVPRARDAGTTSVEVPAHNILMEPGMMTDHVIYQGHKRSYLTEITVLTSAIQPSASQGANTCKKHILMRLHVAVGIQHSTFMHRQEQWCQEFRGPFAGLPAAPLVHGSSVIGWQRARRLACCPTACVDGQQPGAWTQAGAGNCIHRECAQTIHGHTGGDPLAFWTCVRTSWYVAAMMSCTRCGGTPG